MGDKGRLFISYSHKDRRWLEELLVHIRPILDQVDIWDDSKIEAGENWERQIAEALKSADAAILLISPDFLASDFIISHELPHVLHAAHEQGTVILPLLISPTPWEAVPEISQFQFLNPPDKPLASLSQRSRSKAFIEIAERLKSVLASPPSPASSQAVSNAFADDIAHRVFDLLKTDIAGSLQKASKTSEVSSELDPSLVFVVIGFSPDMEPIYEGIQAAALTVGLQAKRVKDVIGDYRITNQVMSMIATCRLVVADLTHERPNVYFELGYARGLGKTVITCARDGTNIHFDVKDWTYLTYIDSRVLERALIDRFRFEMEKGT